MAVPDPRATGTGARWRSRARGALAGAGVAAACLAAAGTARADDMQEYELGKSRFESGEYGEAAKRFERMLDPSAPPCDEAPSGTCRVKDPELAERARALYAATLVALGRTRDAEAQMEVILRANPGYTPNPALFPQEVLDRFTMVKARLREELERLNREKMEQERQKQIEADRRREREQRRIAELERLASTERVVQKNSRWIALLPFGVGQFQNGDKGLGWALLVSQTLTGTASIVLGGVLADRYAAAQEADARARANPGQERVEVEETNQQLATLATFNRVAFGAWAGLALAGIVQAQIAYVPERVTYRKRPLPPSVAPSVRVSPSGATLGVVGRF